MSSKTFKLTAHTLEAAWWRQRYKVQADTIEEAAKKLAAHIENPAEGITGIDEDGEAREEEHEGRLDPEQNFGDSTLTIRPAKGDWPAPPLWTNELPREPEGPTQDECVVYLRGLNKGNFPTFNHAATFILNSTDSWPETHIEGSTYDYLNAIQTRDKSPVLQDWVIVRVSELPKKALFSVLHTHRFGESSYLVTLPETFECGQVGDDPDPESRIIIKALGIDFEPDRGEAIEIFRADDSTIYDINL